MNQFIYFEAKQIKHEQGWINGHQLWTGGQGGNARFHTFQLDHYGWTNGPTDQLTDGRTKHGQKYEKSWLLTDHYRKTIEMAWMHLTVA